MMVIDRLYPLLDLVLQFDIKSIDARPAATRVKSKSLIPIPNTPHRENLWVGSLFITNQKAGNTLRRMMKLAISCLAQIVSLHSFMIVNLRTS